MVLMNLLKRFHSMSDSISVIIPTYKNRGGLIHSIESVLNQDFPNLEIIVVDDNGIGSPFQIATHEIVAKYPSVKYIAHNINRNGAAARNTGIKAATSSYIAFLDDDDIFLPGKLRKQIDYLKINNKYDACYCYTENPDGKRNIVIPYVGDVTEQLLVLKSAMPTSTLMFRTVALEKIGGFDESFRRHQDFELLLRFFNAGFKIGCVEECLTRWGNNNGENILHGQALEDMKTYYFSLFDKVINELELTRPGIKKQIYAIHYSKVFVDHIKMHYWKKAVNILCRHFADNPKIFMNQIITTIKHLIEKQWDSVF